MCFYYDEYPEFAESRIVVARKPHRCAACRGEVAKGETCQVHTGKYDGAFYRDYLCRRCCYDTIRVVEHELVPYLIDSDMGQTDPAAVPAEFKVGDMPKQPERAAVG